MKICRRHTLSLVLVLYAWPMLHAQAVNTTQQVTLLGLLTQANRGNFLAAANAADGSLYLLLDQGDGVRVLKTNAAATTVLAQSHVGATGDAGVAMAVDPNGNVYVTGTSSSGSLAGTGGVPFPSAADTSIELLRRQV
jgi:hypothetical protein